MRIAALAFGSAVITALWIAVCAAAPEFIWQGVRLAFSHPDVSDLLSALLIGVTLAFFVEPLSESVIWCPIESAVLPTIAELRTPSSRSG